MLINIDPKALEHACQCAGRSVHHFDRMGDDLPLRASIIAHARAIEQHEAFKREVSDAVEDYCGYVPPDSPCHPITRFIIAKPDPLVEAIKDCELATLDGIEEGVAYDLRAAIKARGGRIVWEGE